MATEQLGRKDSGFYILDKLHHRAHSRHYAGHTAFRLRGLKSSRATDTDTGNALQQVRFSPATSSEWTTPTPLTEPIISTATLCIPLMSGNGWLSSLECNKEWSNYLYRCRTYDVKPHACLSELLNTEPSQAAGMH
jgi:hypothetical protein